MAPIIIHQSDTFELHKLSQIVREKSNILVFTGAGISTSYGIPDFRSKSGLYSQTIKDTLLGLSRSIPSSTDSTSQAAPVHPILTGISTRDQNAKCITLFDASVSSSQSTMTALYRLCTLLHQKVKCTPRKETSVHAFILKLHLNGKLVRCYTQNIDGLETRYGLQTDMQSFAQEPIPQNTHQSPNFQVVQLHGDTRSVRCSQRSCVLPHTPEISTTFLDGATIDCVRCLRLQKDRQILQKRPSRLSADSVLRPNIILYNEDHPFADHIKEVAENDCQRHPDLLIIMGTSLRVHGARRLLRDFADSVHRDQGLVLIVNREMGDILDEIDFVDYAVSMDCDNWCNTIYPPESSLPESHTRPDVPHTAQKNDITFADLEHELDDQEWLDTYF